MHSSRMRTARLLTVSQHALGREGFAWGCLPRGRCLDRGGCLPRGDVCPGGVSGQGRVSG